MAKCLKTAIHKLNLTQQLVPDSSNYVYNKKFSAHHKHNLIPFVISAYTFKVSELAEIKIKKATSTTLLKAGLPVIVTSYVPPVYVCCVVCGVHFVPVFLCL